MSTAPTLETRRLRLRHHRIEDFEPLAALFAGVRSRHMGGPLGREELWLWFGAEVGSWSLMGFGGWGVDRLEDQVFIGQIGITKPVSYPEVELGWILLSTYEGQGYAHEAALAARDWAFGTCGLDTLVSYIDPANTRSIRLAERLGAQRDDTADRPDPGDLVYRHPAPERLQ